ncbi:MAG: hypothetical protein K9M54_12510 [Kiritimatiellales bacterium]|nr:hypothetical protein [Kiritimatiellales bacterium]
MLGFFELARERNRLASYRRYGEVLRDQENDVEDVGVTSSIYAAPKTIDAWQGRRTRSPKSRHKQSVDLSNIWMGLLRIWCMVLSVVYTGLLVLQVVFGVPGSQEYAWLIGALLFLALFSFVVVVGVLTRKAWGLTWGYLLAICNLLLFPIGTAAGLIMLLGLVGATPLFVIPARERRREERKKAQKKANIAVI